MPLKQVASEYSSASSRQTPDGLAEVGKKYNLAKGRDFPAAVARVQRHKIMVVGSFMIGLDVDGLGAGVKMAHTASHYGVDNLNVSFLTPLPGTKLLGRDEGEGRHPFELLSGRLEVLHADVPGRPL